MELGGKSAAIAYADADFDNAARNVARGILHHAGQNMFSRLAACGASFDRRAVSREASRPRQLRRTVGPGAEDCDMGPVISERQLQRIEALCEVGVAEGATLATGGKRLEREGFFLPPTIFTDVRPDMRIAQEEFFGPITSCYPV
ncbi:aldehyde dehydrogenase family protein [Mesorhizobium atlanticum]